mmetsp:Transcript_23704/g.30838  ORF Transcript_23704/g.30838 Transcript_23704/m.30838 type:complete len:165 (+) Transcript_23704:92-586(+)
MPFIDTGYLNKCLDDVYRQICCRCWTTRPTFPTDPWFKTQEINEYRVIMHRDGKTLDIPYVKENIKRKAGRIKPQYFWLLGTRDVLCCCIPTNDETRFGFLVVREISIEASGQTSVQVWPEHCDKFHNAMANLTDQFDRPISVQRIQRAPPEPPLASATFPSHQ